MTTEFRTIMAGTPRPAVGQVLYVCRFPARSDDTEYGIQRYAGGSGWFPAWHDRYVQTEPLLIEAAKLALTNPATTTWHVEKFWNRGYPTGTVLGVKTRLWGESLADSFALWDLPPFTQTPDLYGIVQKPPTVAFLQQYNILHGYIMEVEIRPGVYLRWDFEFATAPSGDLYVDVDILQQNWRIPIYRHYHDEKAASLVDIMRIYIKQSADDPGPERDPVYYLYHTHEINCEITPAHGTPLTAGEMVYITATPDEDRYLTEFIVQGVEQLPGAFLTPTSDEQRLIDAGILEDTSENAAYVYGPVTSDVYVGAAAYGIDIDIELSAGIPFTQQMTCTDCYAGEWSIGETDLPEGATVSISSEGLLSVYIPEDIYEGLPAGKAFVEIIFTGFSRIASRTLRMTVLPVPAFGTVWDGVTLLDETPQDILLGSDGYVYILGVTKAWKAPTTLDSFTEIANDGSALDTSFKSLVEIENGSLVTADYDYLWVKTVESDVFVKTTMVAASTSRILRVTGSPASNIVAITYKLAGIGGKTGVSVYNVETETLIGAYVINPGSLAAYDPAKGTVAANGQFILPSCADNNRGCLYTLPAGGSEGSVTEDVSAEDSSPIVFTAESGRIYALYKASSYVIGVITSDDDGDTWSSPSTGAVPVNSNPRCAISLKDGYALMGITDDIFRTDDNGATWSAVKTNIGAIYGFLRLADRKLLAITAGSGGFNLWKSEA